MTDPAAPTTPLTDAEKLRTLALWFDLFDSDREKARLLLRETGNSDEVQRDLRRMADEAAARSTPAEALDVERFRRADEAHAIYHRRTNPAHPSSDCNDWIAAEYARLRSPESDR